MFTWLFHRVIWFNSNLQTQLLKKLFQNQILPHNLWKYSSNIPSLKFSKIRSQKIKYLSNPLIFNLIFLLHINLDSSLKYISNIQIYLRIVRIFCDIKGIQSIQLQICDIWLAWMSLIFFSCGSIEKYSKVKSLNCKKGWALMCKASLMKPKIIQVFSEVC